ncbi:retropepsin-like aspartic protease family protein [Diaphorobacter nitroreducens]|uniref:retropepsin-like aspartic protease family protein n=1 Tax=Diaphorobacter nitroreducens TaxID=164759 RepID=UPI00289F5EAC|nr:TIGR02281 family clan AA aspartic protease [Diaphorobacter nitroreducens]
MHRLTLRLAVALLAVTGLPAAYAQSVALAGILGGKALLVVDGSAPRSVAPGGSHMGVRVVSVGRDGVVLEVAGAQRAIQLGESPVSIGGSAAGQRIVLKADARGHFINSGFINGRVMQYMVDTGATTVAIGRPDAQRMGLKFEQGQPVMMNTANGTAQGWRMRLESVRVGDVELSSVDAIVTAEAMPYVLLGNSFLREFHMNRSGDEMVLQRRR